jgi:acetyltransferase-like isoleucine patch superfamily enzyme
MPTSVISKSATIEQNTTIGEYSVIGDNVKVGRRCVIGHRVVIHADTVIGDEVRIDDGAVIGKLPMKAANSAVTKNQQLQKCSIGSGCIVGTNVVIYRGALVGDQVMMADLSTIRENVTIGRKTIVGRGVTIENYCKIGKYVKLETNCYITAYSELEDRVFVAPGVATSNDNYVGRTEERFDKFKGVIIKKGGRIGVNATILPGKTIGEDALVAAGALVTRDVAPRKIVAGSPAKEFGDVPRDHLLENQGWKDN